jgi:hypothetical protein
VLGLRIGGIEHIFGVRNAVVIARRQIRWFTEVRRALARRSISGLTVEKRLTNSIIVEADYLGNHRFHT